MQFSVRKENGKGEKGEEELLADKCLPLSHPSFPFSPFPLFSLLH
jgi:hypothetical protein